MTPEQYCQNKASQSGSSFYYSFLFLPPEKRKAITAVYAFCREVDDIVDDTTHPEIAAQKLAWWSSEVAALYAGTATHPVAVALQPVVKTFAIPQAYLDDIIAGMQMDLNKQRYDDVATLDRYCYHVAGAVGLISALIFGYQDLSTLQYAKALGTAFQYVNIIRDVGEDAVRGRLYLPQSLLNEYHITQEQIFRLNPDPIDFQALMKDMAERAQAHYEHALDLLPEEDRAQQICGLIMARIYFKLLKKIQKQKFPVLKKRVTLTPIQKLWTAIQTAQQEKRTYA